MPLKQLYKEKDPDAWTDFEKGLCSEEDLFKRFFRDGREFDGEGLLQKVNDRCGSVNEAETFADKGISARWQRSQSDFMTSGRRYEWLPGMEELMTELCAEGRNMHILSNYPVWWNNIEGKLQLSRFAKVRVRLLGCVHLHVGCSSRTHASALFHARTQHARAPLSQRGSEVLCARAQWSFVSCDMGLRKPDPAIFKSVQASLALDSAQCLLVDDSAANVDGARAQGWDAILFTDAQDCREQLRQRGFLCGPIQTE